MYGVAMLQLAHFLNCNVHICIIVLLKDFSWNINNNNNAITSKMWAYIDFIQAYIDFIQAYIDFIQAYIDFIQEYIDFIQV